MSLVERLAFSASHTIQSALSHPPQALPDPDMHTLTTPVGPFWVDDFSPADTRVGIGDKRGRYIGCECTHCARADLWAPNRLLLFGRWSWRHKQLEDAAAEARMVSAASENSPRPRGLNALEGLLAERPDPAEARRLLELAVREDPSDSEVIEALSRLSRDLDDGASSEAPHVAIDEGVLPFRLRPARGPVSPEASSCRPRHRSSRGSFVPPPRGPSSWC